MHEYMNDPVEVTVDFLDAACDHERCSGATVATH